MSPCLWYSLRCPILLQNVNEEVPTIDRLCLLSGRFARRAPAPGKVTRKVIYPGIDGDSEEQHRGWVGAG